MIEGSVLDLSWGDHLELPSTRAMESYTHIIGARYPCRSTPLIPRWIIESEKGSLPAGAVILDPFMGSGTTALEASLQGFEPAGLEIDPYARLIAEACSHHYTSTEIDQFVEIKKLLEATFRRMRFAASDVPEISNIEHWFPTQNVRDLVRLRRSLRELLETRSGVEKVVWAVFADIIRAVSYAERQSLKPYVSTKYKKIPREVIPSFLATMDKYLAGMMANAQHDGFGTGVIKWLTGDATSFSMPIGRAALAITSPPYINAMDYVRCIRLESAWIGTGDTEIFKRIRASQLGEGSRARAVEADEEVLEMLELELAALSAVDRTRARVVAAYFSDMKANLDSVYNAIETGSSYYLILGNSVVRGIPMETHSYIARLGEAIGFKWTGYFTYGVRDHRTSLQRKERGGKIDTEHVIRMTKIDTR